MPQAHHDQEAFGQCPHRFWLALKWPLIKSTHGLDELWRALPTEPFFFFLLLLFLPIRSTKTQCLAIWMFFPSSAVRLISPSFVPRRRGWIYPRMRLSLLIAYRWNEFCSNFSWHHQAGNNPQKFYRVHPIPLRDQEGKAEDVIVISPALGLPGKLVVQPQTLNRGLPFSKAENSERRTRNEDAQHCHGRDWVRCWVRARFISLIDQRSGRKDKACINYVRAQQNWVIWKAFAKEKQSEK